MKKLSLDLDAIDVESFLTAEEPREIGTVHGRITLNCTGEWDTCDPCNTMSCDTKANCLPTVFGVTCQYPTCGECNPTNPPDCTTYCP